jgi:hypothetical protein
MNINERASKAEILSAAVELTDSQAQQIEALTTTAADSAGASRSAGDPAGSST